MTQTYIANPSGNRDTKEVKSVICEKSAHYVMVSIVVISQK